MSDDTLIERWRQQNRGRKPMERILVPEDPPIPAEGYAGRNWSPMQRLVEPGYVSYGRLLFEDKNSERYGWDLGVLQPFVSAGLFYCDLVKLPYHLATDPCRILRMQCRLLPAGRPGALPALSSRRQPDGHLCGNGRGDDLDSDLPVEKTQGGGKLHSSPPPCVGRG